MYCRSLYSIYIHPVFKLRQPVQEIPTETKKKRNASSKPQCPIQTRSKKGDIPTTLSFTYL